MASLCHPWFTTTNLSYRFPIFETSATALCGTTGIWIRYSLLANDELNSHWLPLHIAPIPSCSRSRVSLCRSRWCSAATSLGALNFNAIVLCDTWNGPENSQFTSVYPFLRDFPFFPWFSHGLSHFPMVFPWISPAEIDSLTLHLSTSNLRNRNMDFSSGKSTNPITIDYNVGPPR